MLSTRVKSITSIRYVIIAKKIEFTVPILPPESFNDDVLSFVKHCPSDLMEIDNGIQFLRLKNALLLFNPIDLTNVRVDMVDSYLETYKSDKRITLYFIDGLMNNALDIFEKIKSISDKHQFFNFFGVNEIIVSDKHIVNTPLDFIENILNNKEQLKIDFGELLSLEPSVELEHKRLAESNYFDPSINTFCTLNKIIGNIPVSNALSETELKEKIEEQSKEAMKNMYSFERQNIFISQLNERDNMTSLFYDVELLKRAKPSDSKFSTLILSAPYHNPDLKDFIDEKKAKILQVEQTENYLCVLHTNGEGKEPPTENISALQALNLRLRFLDNIGYLHSSFTFSPYIRTPVIGKSINRELSFFSPKKFAKYGFPKNLQSINRSIKKFGKKAIMKLMSNDLQQIISVRNRQIVAITDLPIEWLHLDEIPFSFTHDITRIPETFLPGIVSIFNVNNQFRYVVPKDIISKTLVICGSTEIKFLEWYNKVIEASKRISFNFELCTNNDEVISAIKKFKPDFLIFDCHGGYDEKLKSSFLWIGNDKFDGDVIVNNAISVPLVFLSACGTAPTYGTVNTIANAFFEMGTMAITTTYIPISVDSGSRLYLRILNNLEMAAKDGLNKNWLSFISHVIRTSSIMEAYTPTLDGTDESRLELSKVLVESIFFENRRDLYANMINRFKRIDKYKRAKFYETVPEYLFYSNLGRGDLLLFESWSEIHLKVNDMPDTGEYITPI